MKKKLLKMIFLVILSILLPMVLAAIASGVYLVILLVNGTNLSEGIIALQGMYSGLKPFMPYITIIPASLGILGLIFKNRNRIRNWF